jgi:hypothetical protein
MSYVHDFESEWPTVFLYYPYPFLSSGGQHVRGKLLMTARGPLPNANLFPVDFATGVSFPKLLQLFVIAISRRPNASIRIFGLVTTLEYC